MAELKHISEMLDISDEDAAEVIRDISVSVTAHHLMSDVVGELAAKYGSKPILVGMMLARTFEVNEATIDEAIAGLHMTDKKYDYGHG